MSSSGGLVWTYMGPRQTPPPLPDIPGNQLPEGEELVGAISKEYNWLQGFEGNIDNSHFGFLHFGHMKPEDYPFGSQMWFIDERPRSRVRHDGDRLRLHLRRKAGAAARSRATCTGG